MCKSFQQSVYSVSSFQIVLKLLCAHILYSVYTEYVGVYLKDISTGELFDISKINLPKYTFEKKNDIETAKHWDVSPTCTFLLKY